ncbi:MAG: nucleotidyl transferase AbiEii/AbiGii toxin family protein [Ignavibacteriae bacterium]|nr:nucleotidyl transferase AbiEii/AbiGii toxin family protein [Ignavibacteriota bacterium]
MNKTQYFNQAELLLQVLPIINQHKVFALKGGTAINFFVRNLPRLSVDIDLTYLELKSRDESLADITKRLDEVCNLIGRQFPEIAIQKKYLSGTKFIRGIVVNKNGTTIKIEPNTVIRGSVFDPKELSLCKNAKDEFELSLTAKCLSLADLYGGKICAALDRQHPRDLFDIKLLFGIEGITKDIITAFIFYLISHDRPMVEVLNPNLIEIKQIYENEFIGMTSVIVSLEDLLNIRKNLITDIKNKLTEEQKEFILSFKNIKPDWGLSGIKNLDQYPSVKWKLLNLEKMSKQKHQIAYAKLKEYLIK